MFNLASPARLQMLKPTQYVVGRAILNLAGAHVDVVVALDDSRVAAELNSSLLLSPWLPASP